MGCLWLVINEDVPRKKKEQVQKKLRSMKKDLLASGVSKKQLGKMITKTKELSKKKTGEMSSREQLLLCKVIFGQDSRFSDKKLKYGDTMFDPRTGKTLVYQPKR